MSRELGPPPASAVLVRHHPIVVREISRSGCLLEMRTSPASGTVGLLEVELHGRWHTEMFRVCRVTRIEGAGVFQVGVEFLPVDAAGTGSLRASLAALEAAETAAGRPPATRGLSGCALTSLASGVTGTEADDAKSRGNRRVLANLGTDGRNVPEWPRRCSLDGVNQLAGDGHRRAAPATPPEDNGS